MRYFFDTEFIDDGHEVEMISIGVVSQDGREYYAEAAECRLSRAGQWVVENVVPNLTGPVKPRAQIAADLRLFCGPKPTFWANYASYDWICLCQLYGGMLDVPNGWPHYVNDIQTLRSLMGVGILPRQVDEGRHNALADAKYCFKVYDYLTSMKVKKR